MMLCMLCAHARLKLELDQPYHWQSVLLGDVFSAGRIPDLKHEVLIPKSFIRLESRLEFYLGVKRDLKKITWRSDPKFKYGHFHGWYNSSFYYDPENRRFLINRKDGTTQSVEAYCEEWSVNEPVIIPFLIDDHDGVIVEAQYKEDPIRIVLLAENIGRATLEVRFVCPVGECRKPSMVAWEAFRRSLLDGNELVSSP